MTIEERRAALELASKQAAGCVECRLSETRTQVVYGDGDPEAHLMFIGEAPGQQEDRQGLPFVGQSGMLLNNLLGELGLAREQVYIANVIKCRPPGNRDPLEDEIDACKGYLAEQVRLIDPDVVVTLGNFAAKLLLKRKVGITRLRGQVYPWYGRHVVPTFHPAAGLRGGEKVVAQMREDLTLAVGLIDTTPPPAEQLDLF